MCVCMCVNMCKYMINIYIYNIYIVSLYIYVQRDQEAQYRQRIFIQTTYLLKGCSGNSNNVTSLLLFCILSESFYISRYVCTQYKY